MEDHSWRAVWGSIRSPKSTSFIVRRVRRKKIHSASLNYFLHYLNLVPGENDEPKINPLIKVD